MKPLSYYCDVLLHNKRIFWIKFAQTKMFEWLPDETAIQILYKNAFGKAADLKNPKTFSEKIQWLKLHNHNPLLHKLVDKIEVKDYVAKLIGEEHIIPTIATYNTVDEINPDSLPNQFVIKTANGGGNTSVFVCHDKRQFDFANCFAKLKQAQKVNMYKLRREWAYKGVSARIIVEELLEDSDGLNKNGLVDYKFYSFNGKPYKVMICIDRNCGNPKFYSFDQEWNLLRHNRLGKAASPDFTLPRPHSIDKMFKLAEVLSKDLPFARIDLYNVKNKIYFGEITLYPDAGFDANILPEIDELYGSMIKLN